MRHTIFCQKNGKSKSERTGPTTAEKVPVLFQQRNELGAGSLLGRGVLFQHSRGRFAQISTFRFLAKNGMAHVSKKLSVINHWDLRDAAGNAF